MRRTPFLPLAIALLFGCLVAHHLNSMDTISWLIICGIVAMITALIVALSRQMPHKTVACLLILVFFTIGGSRYCMQRDAAPAWYDLCPTHSFLSLRLNETPSPHKRSLMATADVVAVDGLSTQGTLRLFLRNDSLANTLMLGDKLLVHGYADTLQRTLYSTSDHYFITERGKGLRHQLEGWRQALLRRMQKGPIDHRYAGVVAALTLGWRSDLDGSLRDQFRDAGIMHLLCVSGLHVGLIASIIGLLLFWIPRDRRGRQIRCGVQMTALWGFTLLTALSPATLRAAMMFSLILVSHMLARRTDNMNLLAFVAIVMLIADPTLPFDIGWQLSFSAVTGILMIRPLLQRLHHQIPKAFVVSVAATLATLPFALAAFHSFYPYFIVANVIIVPAASVLLTLSLTYLLLPCSLTAFLTAHTISFCDRLTAAIASWPHAHLAHINLSTANLIAIGVAVFLLLLAINQLANRYPCHRKIMPC